MDKVEKVFKQVIENQAQSENQNELRSIFAEENAIARDAVLDQKSCERDKIREICWKRRFYISWGIGLTCYILTIAYMTFTETALVKSYEARTVGLKEQILFEKRVKHALRKEVDGLNKTIHKGIVAYSDANKNTKALQKHVENYAKVTISSLSEKTDELREQAQAQTKVIKALANQIDKLTEDEASFAEIINSLPDKQKAEWDHFANQLEKDSAATVKYIEQEHEKKLHDKNHNDHAANDRENE